MQQSVIDGHYLGITNVYKTGVLFKIIALGFRGILQLRANLNSPCIANICIAFIYIFGIVSLSAKVRHFSQLAVVRASD